VQTENKCINVWSIGMLYLHLLKHLNIEVMKTFQIDIDFYSAEFIVKAKTKAEAKKKAIAKFKVQVKKHINHIYTDEIK